MPPPDIKSAACCQKTSAGSSGRLKPSRCIIMRKRPPVLVAVNTQRESSSRMRISSSSSPTSTHGSKRRREVGAVARQHRESGNPPAGHASWSRLQRKTWAIKSPVTQGLAHLRHFRVKVRFAELAEHRFVLVRRAAGLLVMDVIQENRPDFCAFISRADGRRCCPLSQSDSSLIALIELKLRG